MLKQSELPPTLRLQARAAKSAIKRAQEIYDALGAREELGKIEDSGERDRRAAELREKADRAIQRIAKRLTELIPTGDESFPSSIGGLNDITTVFTKVSANELIMHRSPAIENLLRRGLTTEGDEIHNLNPAATSYDEFIDAWYKRQSGPKVEDNDDDPTKTVLA